MIRLARMVTLLATVLWLLVVAGGWSPARAKERIWREYRSAHFIVRSNAPRKQAHRLIRDLEWYRHVVGRITNIDFSYSDAPLRLWAWATFDGYLHATGAYGTGGFYNMGLDGAYALMTVQPARNPREIDGRQIILHEYTHHLIHQFSPLQYPRWYDEGFAEFLSTMQFGKDGSIVLGGPLWRAAVLRDFDWVPFRELMESKGQYMTQHRVSMRDPRRARPATDLQYAEGWITVHYLMTHPQRRKQIQTYLSLMNRPDVNDEDAFEQAFQTTYKKLQKEVYQYFWDMKLPRLGITVPDLPKVAVNERKLSATEGAFQNVEAMLVAGDYEGRGAKNWDALVKLYEAGVRPADMAYYLARTALAVEKRRDAFPRWLAAYEKAGGSKAVIASLKARKALDDIFGLKRSFAKPVTLSDRTGLHDLRRALKKAMLADPGDPRPHYFYCLTFAYTDDEKPDRQAMASIGIVRDRLPDVEGGKIVEAILLAKSGERDRALAQLQVMQRWAFSNGEREFLGKVARRIEKMPIAADAAGRAKTSKGR
ncbi:MAG: hypothetical protein D6740_11965 [Alphaproteobacteria bacterium]|nr:MAG: hypothetical protein D6740_11965 [Alphaproteobacteria bacterium]